MREPLRVTARPGEAGVFDVWVPPSLVYFDGHFEGLPILAAFVQLEALVLREASKLWPMRKRLEKLTRLRFRKPILPDAQLTLRLEDIDPRRVRFELRQGAEVCSSGEMQFALETARS